MEFSPFAPSAFLLISFTPCSIFIDDSNSLLLVLCQILQLCIKEKVRTADSCNLLNLMISIWARTLVTSNSNLILSSNIRHAFPSMA